MLFRHIGNISGNIGDLVQWGDGDTSYLANEVNKKATSENIHGRLSNKLSAGADFIGHQKGSRHLGSRRCGPLIRINDWL